MKAMTKLTVTPEMRVTMTLEMNVSEMDGLLEATKDIDRWPMFRFKEAIRQALTAARTAYSSEHVTD